MSDEELFKTIEKIRNAVQLQRDIAFEKAIKSKIDWSEKGSMSLWLTRVLFSMPHKKYTREEAINLLENNDNPRTLSLSTKDTIYTLWYREILNLCDALESARKTIRYLLLHVNG